MSDMNDREKAFENKFVHDEKTNFKIEARTVKLFGLWAAKKLGLSGDEALGYASHLISSNIEKSGLKNVVTKVKEDLSAKEIKISDHALETELQKAGTEAKKQIHTETR